MAEYLDNRPPKKNFPPKEVERLREKAIKEIKSRLLPDDKILKIILIGSSLKDSFGQYDPPGFRGSLYSDFDFIVWVEDDYRIPDWLEPEPDGRPFDEDELNLAFRQKKMIDNKYDVEIFFVRRSSLDDSKIQEMGEQAGIPMTNKSKNSHLMVYSN